MSVKSEAEDLQRQRAREAALRQRLDQLEAEKRTENSTELSPAERQLEHGEAERIRLDKVREGALNDSLELTQEEQLNAIREKNQTALAPSRLRQQEKPWMRNGKQFRPKTNSERQAEMDERLDKQALTRLAEYRELVQKDADLSLAEEKARQARQRKEERTGARSIHLSQKTEEFISLEEAQRRGYIGNGFPMIEELPDYNPYDNRRGRPDTFGGGL